MAKAIVRAFNYVVVELDGTPYELGSLSRPNFKAIDGEQSAGSRTVTASGTESIWTPSGHGMSGFKFLWMASDFDLTVQLVVDADNSVGKVPFTLPLIGTGCSGDMGPPLELFDDASYANFTEDFATGTLDQIDKITVKNESSTQASQVQFFIVE